MVRAKRPPAESTGGRRAATAAPPERALRVGVYEPAQANRKRTAAVCEQLGYGVVVYADVAAALAGLAADDALGAVMAGLPGGEEVLAAAGDRVRIATVAGPAATAAARTDAAAAELFAIRPLDADAVATVLRAAEVLASVRAQARAAEPGREPPGAKFAVAPQPGFQSLAAFERALVTEIKRAKRYGYSLAVCLVGVDPRADGEPEPSAEAVSRLRNRVASAVTAAIREIDVPVDVAVDRFLLFLPFTDIDGAERVGRRVASIVRSYGRVDDQGRELVMSVSVGIAALRPGKPVSFARLMRDAGAALRAAQGRGRGQLVVRR